MLLQSSRKLATLIGMFLVAILFFTAAVGQEINTASEAPAPVNPEEQPETETKKPIVLTGDPQKDYVHDPNLPFELHGYDLSDYPFYKRPPKDAYNFTCDDRHDGFYASIPHKCQVYHNCLFGIRYDFLCPNYTAFDQTNFICHFANEVDCKNSELYFFRNDALYKETTTTTTTTAAPQIKIVYVDRPAPPPKQGQKRIPGRRKPTTTTAAPSDYYEYYDEVDEPKPGTSNDDVYYYYDEPESQPTIASTTTSTTTTARPLPRRKQNRPLRTRSQALQGNRRRNDQSVANNDPSLDYDTVITQPRRRRPNAGAPQRKRKRRRRKKTTTTSTTSTTPAPEYYDDYYYDDYYDDPQPSSTTTTEKPKPLQRPPLVGSRPTAQDRRKALLETRRSQLQQAEAQRAAHAATSKPEPAAVVYDDTVVAEDTATVIEEPPFYTDVDYITDNQPREDNPNRRGAVQNARRPGAFTRPRNRRLKNRTPAE